MKPSRARRNSLFLAIVTACCVGGCKRATVEVQPVALKPPTPTPKPTPTPRPTVKPKAKGVMLYKVKTTKKVFALTFDDGPDPTWTPKVLAILKQKKAPATFFMVGEMVRAHASTGQKVVKAGHAVGGHSWAHPMRTHSPVMEIERTDAMIKSELGVTHRLFRPPYGLLKNGLARGGERARSGRDFVVVRFQRLEP